jgi:hypothetical protein
MGSQNVRLENTVNNFLGVGLSSTSEIQSNSVNLFNMLRVTQQGGMLQGRWDYKNANFTVDGNVTGYFIDTSAGNVTATFDVLNTTSKLITFIIINNANTFIIDENTGVGSINGNACPYSLPTNLYDWYNVTSDGAVLYLEPLSTGGGGGLSQQQVEGLI